MKHLRAIKMFSTKHTEEAGQNYFEHLKFATGLFSISFISSLHFIAHGLTGGLYNAPEKYSLKSVVQYLSSELKDLESRKNS